MARVRPQPTPIAAEANSLSANNIFELAHIPDFRPEHNSGDFRLSQQPLLLVVGAFRLNSYSLEESIAGTARTIKRMPVCYESPEDTIYGDYRLTGYNARPATELREIHSTFLANIRLSGGLIIDPDMNGADYLPTFYSPRKNNLEIGAFDFSAVDVIQLVGRGLRRCVRRYNFAS